MPLTTNELIQRSRCFDCLPWSTQFEIQTYIIAFASGQGTDPNTLAEAAKCLKCLSLPTLTEVKAFLLARIAGVSTDPNTLAAAAKCYVCIPDGLIGAINTYLWSTDPAGPGITDPNALAQAAKAFQRLSPETLLEIQVYLLALQAGVTTDPDQLAELAKCFKCLPLPFLRDVGTYLVQTFIEGGGCVDVAADLIPVITGNYLAGIIDSFTVTFPKVCCFPKGWAQYGSQSSDMSSPVLIASSDFLPPTPTGGQANYTITVPALGVGFAYYAIAQVCADLSESGLSNSVLSTDPNLGNTAANNFSTRAQANGGVAAPPAILTALETLWNDLNAHGLISKIIALNAFDPTNLVNACTPFIVNAGNDPWTNNNFVAGDLSQDGLMGNGTNKYLQTGIIPSVQWPIVTPIHGGIGIYTLTADDAVMGEFGTQQGGNNEQLLNSSAGSAIFGTYGGTCGVDAICVANSLFRGFLIGSRTTDSHAELFKASALSPFASIGTLLTPGNTGASNNTEMICHAINVGGVVGQFSRRQISFAVVFNDMSAAECQYLYNAAETCRHNMGGGFVVDVNNATEVVNDWERRLVLAGGAAASAATKTALTTFWNACITAGIQEKFYSLCPFVPDNLIAAITPLIDTVGLASYTNTGFVGADLTVNGLKGDGATKYLDTGVASDRVFNSTSGPFGCLGLYVSLGASESKVDTGSQFFTGSPDFWLASDFSGTMIFDCWNNGTGRTSFANTPFTGFICASRTTAARTDIYTANSGLPIASRANNTNNLAGATIPEYPIFVFAIDDTGAASVFSSKRLSFFWVGQGLSATEASNLFNAVQQLRTDLGGGFV